ncbi:putative DNA-directed RNA polymerase III RPC4 [Aspergillus alliaceus]|uniref:putative DNA-directed RNA polymerase III RPC4 n=1 Tax=Petromyces alliaceus TaxID=209559 RepID=UPI0012A71D74|nr:RNA polymerase III RPC4-domain-containing protein [Aspergillus alliaceus]KAB8233844.1 RNA polymerase III RPC4-domain-containing protein [Aspergillus alliaceus]
MAGRRGRGGGPGGFGARFGGQDSRASSMSRRSRSVIDIASGAASRDVSSDESDNEIRVSIDHINLDSDEEEEAEQMVDKKKGKLAMRNADSGERGLRPIRVERQEHEERAVSVNMESSSSKSAELRQQAQAKAGEDDALFVQDDDGSATEKENALRVKQEPTDDDQAMADVAPHADEGLTTDDGLLPEQKVKVRRKISREPPAVKDPKSLLRTREDVEEYERHEQDLAMVKDLFTKEEKPQPEQSEQAESSAEDAETAAADGAEKEQEKISEEEEDESAKDKLSGQLFLMQFPPMTPNLVPGGRGNNPGAESIEIQDQDTPNGTNSNSSNQPQPPPQQTAVKHEDGGEILDGADESQPTEPSKVVTATDWQLKAGRVGKLNVHASGKITMDWGGISFELDRATAVDFLQEALIVSAAADPAEGGVPEEENRVWAMGQLSGKFTVTPDWEKML